MLNKIHEKIQLIRLLLADPSDHAV